MKSRETLISAFNGLFVLTALLGLSLLAGCPGDESADMASQISRSKNAPSGGGKAKAAAKDEEQKEGEGEAVPEVETPAEGEEVPAVDGTKVEVEVMSIEVKAPYPEYADEGYYDIFMEVLAPKHPETKLTYGTAVWRFIGFDKDGMEVLNFVKQIKVPDTKPGPLRFNGMYCMAAPVRFEFYITDKTASSGEAPAEDAGAGGRGRGGGSGAERGAGGAGGGGGGEGTEEPPIDEGDE